MTSKYHKTKSGKMARKGLWYNIQQKKKRIAAGSGEKIKNLEAKVHQQLKQLKNHRHNYGNNCIKRIRKSFYKKS
jgi:ElaB/YqjD/DUF883 family membrane-anchored ribosome-binding protein